MHQQRVARRHRGHQVLGAPRQRVDSLTFEPRSEASRKRTAEIRTTKLDVSDRLVGEVRLEAAADRFDFGKLRHSVRIPFAPPTMVAEAAVPG